MTSPHIIARVKAATDLAQLVSVYCETRRSLILCPWHSEKNPSCRVYEDHVYCFTCNKGGDCFAFLQQVESISFHEALKRLADAASISLDERPVSRVAMQFAREEAALCKWWWELRRERQMRQVYAHMESEDEEMLEIIAMPLRADDALTVAQRFEMFRARVTEGQRAEWRAEVQWGRDFAKAWMSLASQEGA